MINRKWKSISKFESEFWRIIIK